MGVLTAYLKLFGIGMIPALASVLFYHLDKTKLKDSDYWFKQLSFGVIFGIFSILGTEFGVHINGATINVRDAAPIICAICLGSPAGILAGLIGGIERYYAVAWGAGEFTVWACTFGTILAGILGATLRRYIFDTHIPRPIYGVAAGFVAEIMHMNLIFVTRFARVEEAVRVVQACTIPMVAVNAIVCGLALVFVRIYKHHTEGKEAKEKINISRVFQRGLLTVIVLTFLVTNAFSILIQLSIASKNAKQELILNIDDAKEDVIFASNNYLLRKANEVSQVLNNASLTDLDDHTLMTIADSADISEINIVDENGIIIKSTNPDFIGFDFHSGDQAREFLVCLNGVESYVQEFAPISYDSNIWRKYAANVLDDGGFVQVGFDSDKYYENFAIDISHLAYNRRVGLNGELVIAELNGKIVSESQYEYLTDMGIDIDETQTAGTLYNGVIDDKEVHYSFDIVEAYYIIGILSNEEAMMTANINIYLTSFLEILVFFAIFIMIFVLIDRKVVKDVKSVNESLKQITDGDLDTVVNVRDNLEFESLSDDINSTVDRLKGLIAEAEERNKAELEYAAQIQMSALPSTFPAFPERDEFDIYAIMDPAREVGGDFYDFYFIGRHKLAILIADVSGKGVPASLFMMRGKTLIKSYAERGIRVNDIFTNANFNLCEGNEAGLFITAWMGVLDLRTGHLQFANAGHNPPLIKRGDGQYEYLKTSPGFILGGMEGIAYKLQETDLEEGSEIFLYTDGLTEAQNKDQELYGEERLFNCINSKSFISSKGICEYIKNNVEEFVGLNDQFDDLTMLHLKFIKRSEAKEHK